MTDPTPCMGTPPPQTSWTLTGTNAPADTLNGALAPEQAEPSLAIAASVIAYPLPAGQDVSTEAVAFGSPVWMVPDRTTAPSDVVIRHCTEFTLGPPGGIVSASRTVPPRSARGSQLTEVAAIQKPSVAPTIRTAAAGAIVSDRRSPSRCRRLRRCPRSRPACSGC